MCCAFALLIFTIALSGCGGGGAQRGEGKPQAVPAGGVVLYNQQPVADATVIFHPQAEGGQGATARTDASGKFQLMTYQPGDGAVPGEYLVTVSKVEVPGAGLAEAPVEDDPAAATAEEIWHIPQRYGDAGSSDLKATVAPQGENQFTFELTD